MVRALIFSLIVSLAAGAILTHDRAYYEAKFFGWMEKFATKAEDGSKFVHFLENFIQNDLHIENHNLSNATYTLGHNQFSHLSYEEWLKVVNLGLAAPTNEPADFVHAAPADLTTVPAEVDWTKVPGAVTPVKDQGQCGSCWSFSSTGALEGAYYITNKEGISLSEQNLVSCDNRKGGGSDMGCHGGLMDSAFKWVKSNGGICTEEAYPYVSAKGDNPACDQSKCTKVAKSTVKSFTDVTINSDAAMMSALAQQPVSIAIEADEKDFQLYQSGVFTAKCGANLDHGVLAVGYGTWTDGLDYYKVKNSWGPTWGMDGYILLQRGVEQKEGQCGILSGPPSYPTV